MLEEPVAIDGNRRLLGRRILITSAAASIGRAVAELFANHGVKLALVDINEGGVTDVGNKLSASGLPFDLANVDGLEALGTGRPIEQADLAFIQNFAAINLIAPYMIYKAALAHMRKAGGGTILDIAAGCRWWQVLSLNGR